jgi:hypothetical protein
METTMTYEEPLAPVPALAEPRGLRDVLAGLLRAASALLDRVAAHVALATPAVQAAPAHAAIEFYAEAGAPEGALYCNGEWVGTLPVARL